MSVSINRYRKSNTGSPLIPSSMTLNDLYGVIALLLLFHRIRLLANYVSVVEIDL